jgi:hypothetical protein
MSFWEASIWLRQAGQSRRVSPAEQFQPQVPDINNEAQAVWFFDHYPQLGKGIAMWDDGLNRTVTDWGQNPAINDRGDLYFIRLHPTLQTYHPWLLLAGELIQLTDATRSTDGDIANTGDVVWRFGPTFQSDILYLKRFSSGDLNCDGALDAFDIESFINAMLDPAGYRSAFPTCDPLLADVNEDGAVDAFDIEPFIALLIP